MTKSRATDAVPIAAGKYQPPPRGVLPKQLHSAHAACGSAAEFWARALQARKDAERLERAVERDHAVALRLAALDGIDPATVTDERAAKRAAVALARDVERAADDAARTRWAELVRGIVEHRAEVLDLIAPDLDSAQAECLEALAAFHAARSRMEKAIGAHRWVIGLRPRGGIGGVSTAQGPRALPPASIMYADRSGKVHTADPRALNQALEVLARGKDAVEKWDRYDVAIAARKAGDAAAQAAQVPSPHLAVG